MVSLLSQYPSKIFTQHDQGSETDNMSHSQASFHEFRSNPAPAVNSIDEVATQMFLCLSKQQEKGTTHGCSLFSQTERY
jgi:hypothetical protein